MKMMDKIRRYIAVGMITMGLGCSHRKPLSYLEKNARIAQGYEVLLTEGDLGPGYAIRVGKYTHQPTGFDGALVTGLDYDGDGNIDEVIQDYMTPENPLGKLASKSKLSEIEQVVLMNSLGSQK